jgi:hypothetical protein
MFGRKATAVRGMLALAVLVSLQFSLGCGGSGTSGGGPPPPPPSNPVPAIVSLSPNSATAGAAAFTLTITGENFLSSSTVQWNGISRVATFTSSTQLQAQITAADIASSGLATVSVTNPAPGGGNSGSAEFSITATSNPAPSLGSVSPSTVSAGSSEFILTLNGSNFIPASTIQWNGSVLATIYLSESQLEAEIPATNVATFGFAEVMVVNPAPGGGASAPVVFSIAYGPTVVNQAANDLVWDATRQLIYLAVPSLAASNGNSITVLDPTTGSIKSSQFAGSEPSRLAISGDDQFLYAGIEGSSSVQRFTLPNLTPDIQYFLGADPVSGPYAAFDVQVAPGLPHTTAVSRGPDNLAGADGGMVIYDDVTARPKIAHGTYDSQQWASDTTIYANNSEVTNFDLYALYVSTSGVAQSKDYPNEFSNFYISIHYDSGTKLIYTDDGYVINPSNGQQVGSFQAAGLMIPDSTLNSAFFLGQTANQSGTPNFTIEELDLTTFAPVAEIVVPNVQGYPLHFIRWGGNGLAFNDNAGYVYVLNSPFVTANGERVVTSRRYMTPVARIKSRPKMIQPPKVIAQRTRLNSKTRRLSADSTESNPAPAITSLTPNTVTAGVNGFTLTVTGTNFLSFSTIEWNGSQLPTEYVSSSELQAQVSPADVATSGAVPVSVMTPSPGGGSSSTLPFTIVSESSNPAPVIVSLYPDYAAAGSAGFTMNVNGLAYFNSSSVVLWNGSPRSSTLYSPGQLQVQIKASDVATPGYALVTVVNPGPGGGTSSAEFQILYQPTILNQATNDLVWDPVNQVIYISVPSSATMHANQVCILNPVTTTIGNCQAGNEPDVLAISDDSQFLYVGEDGTGSVQRFTLPGLVPDISYSLGNYSNGAPYYALDLQVAPGAPHTTAVTKGDADLSDRAVGGITIFDDSTPRPTSTPEDGYPGGGVFASIRWGADATVLYAANSETSGNDFYTLTVSSSGVVLSQDYREVFWNPGRIHYDRGTGLVYSDDGYHAVNPSTGLPAGLFEVGGGWPMAPDSTLNTVFILDRYVWQENSNFTIDFFDMTHYTPVNRVPFSTTSPPGQDILIQPNRFIRWGTNGLAVNDMEGNLYLISGSFVSAANHKSRSLTLAKRIRTP